MKYLLIVLLGLTGCGLPVSTTTVITSTTTTDTPIQQPTKDIGLGSYDDIQVIDGCEYIVHNSGGVYGICHKANCDNPIHLKRGF